ncbi:MAG TPA: hypothetical protein VJN19_12330 [Propionibacteriaceae bacterium]|nr:hypothetical protein [Propionibacteriaceae bacterium]
MPRDSRPFQADLAALQLLLPPSACFASLTAAELRGWWRPQVAHPVFVSVPSDDPHPQRRGMFVTRHPRPVDSEVIDGIRVASAAETLLAAARDLSLLDLVVLGDSALHVHACTKDELWHAAAQRRRGAPRLRVAIPLLDGRSESAWESVLRLLHFAAEVEVEPQKQIHDEWGRFVARADLWMWARVVSTSTTVGRTATEKLTARTLPVSGVWSRSIGSASASHHRSCCTRQHRSSPAWIGCWDVLGALAA